MVQALLSFSVIFAILALGQLAFLLFFALRRKGGNTSGITTEKAIRGYRLRLTILMALNFVFLTLEYSLRASILYSQTLSITTILAYVSMPEFADALLYATILVLLDSSTGSTEVLAPRSSNGKVNIPVTVSLLTAMVILTVARNVVIWKLSITQSSEEVGSWGLGLAELILHHLHILIYLVLAVYFTLVAISIWNQRHNRVTVRFGLEGNLNLRVMKRITKHICPLICLSTTFTIISDILQYTIIGIGNVQVYCLVNLIISGTITSMLGLVVLDTGVAL